jgi:hypothetical protein
LAGIEIRFDGVLHGLVTWGIATLLTLLLLTSAIGGIIGGGFSALGSVASAAGSGVSDVAKKLGDLLLAEGFRQCHVGAVGGDFVVLDALHPGNDDEIEDGAFSSRSSISCWASSTSPRIASQTLRPGLTSSCSRACSTRSI